MNERERFVELWSKESATTQKVVERIPEGSDYRPDPKSRTAREIAWQIIAEERMITEALEQGTAQWAPPPLPPTMREIVDVYTRQRSELSERWGRLSAERWAGSVEFFGTVRPAAAMAWSFLLDIVHHRGQISTYLRPMGAKVPQIYGPSGDEP